MALGKRLQNALAAVVLLAVAALLWTAIDASRKLTELQLVTRISCDRAGGRVLISGRGGVRVVDESGASRGALVDRDGRPVTLDGFNTAAAGPDGKVWVLESRQGNLHRFVPGVKAEEDLTLEATVRLGEGTLRGPSGLLPLANGRVVIVDTVGKELRLHGADGKLLHKRAVDYPNSPLRLDSGGFALVVTGDRKLRAFDDDLRPMDLEGELGRLNVRGSFYDVDVDGSGTVYWNSCRSFSHCSVLRRAPGESDAEVVGADDWLAGYDDTDPAYFFCATSDGRVLSASQTFGAVVQYTGALAEGPRPADLSWVYLADKMLGRHGGVRTTLTHAATVGRRVLWPDRGALVLWALPGVAVWAVAAVSGFLLYEQKWIGKADLLALVIVTGFLVPKVLSARKLAQRRSPEAAAQAYELYLSSVAAHPLPPSATFTPKLASFAAPPDSGWVGEGLEAILEEAVAVDGNPLEIASVLEGELFLVAWGERRLVWFPSQLGGKPRGRIRIAAVLPRPTPGESGAAPAHLDLPTGQLVGVAAALVERLGTAPKLGGVEELCAVCGREIVADPSRRCPHHRFRPRLARTLAVLLPGLGHLTVGRYQRGRWLLLAAALLVSRMLYLAAPMWIGSLPFEALFYVVPLSLYAVVWWISFSEIRRFTATRAAA